eukprot:1152622-Pelagomonas_calceolata.AAC.3
MRHEGLCQRLWSGTASMFMIIWNDAMKRGIIVSIQENGQACHGIKPSARSLAVRPSLVSLLDREGLWSK